MAEIISLIASIRRNEENATSIAEIKMNRNQKILSLCAVAVFAASALLAPWEKKMVTNDMVLAGSAGYSPIWQPPSPAGPVAVQLRGDSILMEWAAIAIVYGVLFAVLATPRKSNSESD